MRAKPVFLATALAVASQFVTASAETIELDKARTLAYQLIADGRYDTAAALARTLLEADPNDQAALLALAQAEQGAGRTREAVKAARAAWRASKTPARKYASASVAAYALAADNQRLRAQFWLRRAAQVAPRPEFRAKAQQEFRTLRANTPVRVNLRFAISPSSNINNGAKSGTANFGGLTFVLNGDARALSGVEYQLGGDITYQNPVSQRQVLTYGFSLDTRSYTLSSSAKALAPNASGSDYAFQEAKLIFGSTWYSDDNSASTNATLQLGQNWFGGTSLTQFASATLTRSFRVGERSNLSFSGKVERQKRLDADIRSATIGSLSTRFAHQTGAGNILSLSAEISDTRSDSSAIAHEAAELEVGYRLAKPIFGKTQLDLSLGVERRSYDRVFLPPAARRDTSYTARATMTLNDLEYYGFAPTLSVNAKQTRSNITLYETEEIGLSLGLRSSF